MASAGVVFLAGCSSGGSSQTTADAGGGVQSAPTGSAATPTTSSGVGTPTSSGSSVATPTESAPGKATKTSVATSTGTSTSNSGHSPSGRGEGSSQPPSSGTGKTGGIYQTVPPRHRKTLAPVPLKKPADVGSVTERILSIDSIHAAAHGPGEVAGPGLKIVIQVSNDSAKPIDLTTALMTVSDAAGTPGVEMTLNGTDPLRGQLAAHSSAQGTYVFTLPPTHRDPVTVNFSYSSVAPVTLFVGTVK